MATGCMLTKVAAVRWIVLAAFAGALYAQLLGPQIRAGAAKTEITPDLKKHGPVYIWPASAITGSLPGFTTICMRVAWRSAPKLSWLSVRFGFPSRSKMARAISTSGSKLSSGQPAQLRSQMASSNDTESPYAKGF